MQTGKYILTSYFEWQGHSITVQNSTLSGKEWVYVDEELISHKRSLGYSSNHSFTLDGQKLDVHILVHSVMKGPIDIKLMLGEQCLDEDSFDYQQIMPGGKSFKRVVFEGFVTGLIFGAVGMFVGYTVTTWLKG
ncbi:hypothetical protein L2725_00920 [Shewanella corallii]|uniref:Uncharacterized protein n=1 Tax=Shewanella corallii TaxID=560080 RepID=A0ABT0N1Q5_9GAMM|nr:hypothetical protein [Shewanella corallii]MCL2912356.1 hypothetical protein [Shewanella corallii]